MASINKKLKIVEVVPKFKLAGAERMAESLIYGLIDSGQSVEAVSLYDYSSSITAGFFENNVQLHMLDKKEGLDLSLPKKLEHLFKAVRPDVVHTHLYAAKYAIPAAKKTNVPVCIHTVHSVAEEELSSIDKRLQYFFYHKNWAIPVAISPMVLDTVIDCYKLPKDSVPLVFNGVTRAVRPQTNSKSQSFEFLHIGRFEPVKNHEVLVRAFRLVLESMPESNLTLLGTGELFPAIEELVNSLGLSAKVNLVGEVSDVQPYFAKSDAFVLPSVYEGFPITLIEALQAGVPCVCTNVGGIPDIVTDGFNGLLCEPTVESLANAMKRVATDANLLQGLSSNCKLSCVNYTQEKMSEGYLSLMRRLVENA